MGKRWGSLIFCTILSTSIVSVTAKNAVQDLCKVFFRPMENQKWPPIISYNQRRSITLSLEERNAIFKKLEKM